MRWDGHRRWLGLQPAFLPPGCSSLSHLSPQAFSAGLLPVKSPGLQPTALRPYSCLVCRSQHTFSLFFYWSEQSQSWSRPWVGGAAQVSPTTSWGRAGHLRGKAEFFGAVLGSSWSHSPCPEKWPSSLSKVGLQALCIPQASPGVGELA